MLAPARVPVFLLCLWLALCAAAASAQESQASGAVQADTDPDVRLVIDVSGSMKRNDPNNLRQPAVELLVELLPEQASAGVWTFGKWVNMLVKHQKVDDKWRESARSLAPKINSAGLYTNIGEALEKAAYDISYTDADKNKQIILLTDGMVDIDKQSQLNQKEWRRIVDELIPKLKAGGYRIHTIALSNNADRDLMNKLSVATDGLAELAEDADQLMQIFLKAFDAAAPAEQVELSDNQFVIDSSVEEFTALIFRKKASGTVALASPDQQRLSASTNDSDLRWHRAHNYDLITVKRPLEGTWYIDGEIAEQSRVTVVSNLNLRLKPLPTNIISGDKLALEALLQEDGQIIANPDFLALMDVEAELSGGHSFDSLVSVWKQALKQDGAYGRYRAALPELTNEGVYELKISVDGKTFQRQLKHQMTLRRPFSAELRQAFVDGSVRYLLTVNAFHSELDYNSVSIVASIAGPNNSNFTRSLSFTEADNWQAEFMPDLEGDYVAKLRVKARSKNGAQLDNELQALKFSYSADSGLSQSEKPFAEASVENEEPVEELETAEPVEAQESVEPAQEDAAQTEGPPAWMLYAALGVGNLLLLGLGYFAFRKIMGGPKKDILDEIEAEEKALEEQSDAAALDDEPEPEEDEPPMEDLDPDAAEPEAAMSMDNDEQLLAEPDSSTDEPEPENAPADEPAMDDLDGSADEAFDALETMADEAEQAEDSADSDLAAELEGFDELDDLDAMTMEQEMTAEQGAAEGSDAQNQAEQSSEEASDDDMVQAMLEAQGLDLAEEELDDAISSLIDDLEDDDDENK